MDDNQTPNITPTPYRRSPIEVALELKHELDAYERNGDRRVLVGALKDQFLMNRLVSSSQAEVNRDYGLQILFNRLDRMSDNMLLKVVERLSHMGALDLTAFTGGTLPPGGRHAPPTVSIQQAFGNAPPSALESRTASNPVKETGMLLEAVEHAARYLRGKGTHSIGPEK